MPKTNSNQPLRVGLTGGIASGKSTVADLFAAMGVPIIDTDVIAREVVAPGEPALKAIASRFGAAIIASDGSLRRRALRREIFNNEVARQDLEAILHPLIGAETVRQSEAAGGPYQMIAVPLLVGSDLLAYVDRVLVVDCDEQTQIDRLLRRDTETLQQARKILASQATRTQRLALADDVIDNSGALKDTKRQVRSLDRLYRSICESTGCSAE